MTVKSVWAVVAGVLFIIVATTLVDILLHAVGVFPPMNVAIDDKQALIPGVVGTILELAGIALAVVALPQCGAGGKIHEWANM